MSVGSVLPSTSNFQTSGQQMMAQYMQTLSQALQSGNTQSAQQAYNSLTQNLPKQNAASGFNKHVNPVQQKFAEIGTALKSGDLDSAKAAMQAIEQHVQAHDNHIARMQSPDSPPPALTLPPAAPQDPASSDQSSSDDGSSPTFGPGPKRFVGLVA